MFSNFCAATLGGAGDKLQLPQTVTQKLRIPLTSFNDDRQDLVPRRSGPAPFLVRAPRSTFGACRFRPPPFD
jgi:hypothetical protein